MGRLMEFPRTCAIAGLWVAMVIGTAATAQTEPLFDEVVPFELDSGFVKNTGRDRAVVFRTLVTAPGRPWLRLTFDDVILGAAPIGAMPTILRITSLKDNGEQRLVARHVQEWRQTSALFNGDSLIVEIVADPGAAPSRVVMSRLTAGSAGLITSICGAIDDRTLSSDPRAGRFWNAGCTAWLIDDPNHCFLSAGHCTSNPAIVEFNVPLSNGTGGINFSHPDDQYSVDLTSVQSNGGQGVGNDYAYFGCFANSNTGLTPFQAQGDYYVLAEEPPPAGGQDIRVTGYGTTTGTNLPNTWNQVETTHVGPFTLSSGTVVGYQTDTTGGNSGSPVIFDDTGEAIGVHTHGGCDTSGQNHGTAVDHPGLQNFLANPRGVCVPTTPERVVAENFAVTFGDLEGGGLAELAESDNAYVRILQRTAVSPLIPVARIEVQATSPFQSLSEMTVILEARATVLPATVPQRLEMFNFDAVNFEIVDERTATFSDSVAEVTITGDPDRFVQTGGRTIFARAMWFDPGNAAFASWRAMVDQIVWDVTP